MLFRDVIKFAAWFLSTPFETSSFIRVSPFFTNMYFMISSGTAFSGFTRAFGLLAAFLVVRFSKLGSIELSYDFI